MSAWAEQVRLQLQDTASAAGWPEWVNDARIRAGQTFLATGLPHRRLEEWKYTPLVSLEKTLSGLGEAGPGQQVSPQSLDFPCQARIVMLDGAHAGIEGEIPQGVEIHSLSQLLKADDERAKKLLGTLVYSEPSLSLAALNHATLEHGLFIHVKAGVDAGRVFLQWAGGDSEQSQLFNSRVLVIMEQGAQLDLVEHFPGLSHEGNATGLNLVYQFKLEDSARVTHSRLQQGGNNDTLVSRNEIEQLGNSHYFYTGLDLGQGLARHDIQVELAASQAQCQINGAYLLTGSSHVDNHLVVNHRSAGCSSGQYFRGVMKDQSKAVFNGMVHVFPGADESEARQSNANLLLSEDAEVNTKPELIIEADEVVASHGATVGQLDDNAVFYLRSRGIEEEQARQMLTGAFCRAVVDEMNEGPVREVFSRALAEHKVMPS